MQKQNIGSVTGRPARVATITGRSYYRLILTVLCALFAVGAPQAAPIGVNSTEQGPGATGNCTLTEAITAANTDSAVDGCAAGLGADVLFLPGGNYTLLTAYEDSDGVATDNGLPAVTSDITVLVAAEGDLDSAVIERDAAASSDFRIFYVSPVGVLRLIGLSVTGGRFDGPGGGIFVDQGELIIEGGAVSGNRALGNNGGGGIGNLGGRVTLTRSSLIGNSANNGGGISNTGEVVIIESELSDNVASDNGGAIDNDAGTVVIDKKTLLSSNAAGADGGAIHNRGTLSIHNRTTVTENVAGANGGGIFSDGIVAINFSILSKNEAGVNGGGFYNSGGPATVSGATLSQNKAGGSGSGGGGAVYNAAGAAGVMINESTIIENTASDGAGIFNAAVLSIVNATLGDNSAETSGGAVFSAVNAVSTSIHSSTIAGNTAVAGGGIFVEPSSVPVTLKNTILASNEATDGSDCNGNVQSLDHNLIGDPGSSCGIVPADHDVVGEAKLDDFANDNTPGNGHFNLMVTSPAVDKGDDNACPINDQISQARINRCDIGAIEFPELIPESGGIELKSAKIILYHDSDNFELDSFSIKANLIVSPFEQFKQPFSDDLEIIAEIEVGSEWQKVYTVSIPANTVDGINPKNGELRKSYTFGGPAPVRKTTLSEPLESFVKMYVEVEQVDLFKALRSQLEPPDYLETLKNIKSFKLTVRFGNFSWSGKAPLSIARLTGRKIKFALSN